MEQLLNIQELAVLLGVEVSTIYSWTCRRSIPYLKIGKLLRFRVSDVELWIEEKIVLPSSTVVKKSHKESMKNKPHTAADDLVSRLVRTAQKEVLG